MILSHFLTGSIIEPIENLADNLDASDSVKVYKELVPFVQTIKKQHEDIMRNATMRQEFTANVSHELKTPLTSISGYSELIESGMAADEDIVRFAAEIHKNSNRLLTLINDIIRLSELDQVEEQNCFEELDIYDIAQNCVEMLRLSAKKHDVTMELHGVHRIICANRQMMDELVYNLCDNAIRYNNPGGRVDITVDAAVAFDKTAETGATIIEVKDTGIGISKEHQERIFERFYRVDKSRSKSTGGTGLGLAIVKHIVAAHKNASLSLTSEPGKGTCIRVAFKMKTNLE
jgi:two-component system phosphate regulon sensor histidine kinase PhoR